VLGGIEFIKNTIIDGSTQWIWDDAFNVYTYMNQKFLSTVARADVSTEKWIESVRDGLKQFSIIANETISSAGASGASQQQIDNSKIIMGASLWLMIDDIEKRVPWSTEPYIRTLWDETLRVAADVLTSATPSSMETAYELTTWKNTNPKWWSGGRKRTAKDVEIAEKKRSKIIEGYNNLVNYSARFPANPDISLPKFQYIRDAATWWYRAVKVDVKPVFKDLVSKQIRANSPKPEGLTVARAPVKRGRVSSGRTRVTRTIAGAKIYSKKTPW
jgi:hypothetical protein